MATHFHFDNTLGAGFIGCLITATYVSPHQVYLDLLTNLSPRHAQLVRRHMYPDFHVLPELFKRPQSG